MRTVDFVEYLPASYKDALIELLFFHPQQIRYSKAIDFNLLEYGEIKVREANNNLFVELSNIRARTLFVMDSLPPDGALLGVVLYCFDKKLLVIVHIAIVKECMENNLFQSEIILYRLIEKLRSIYSASRFNFILLPYHKKKISVNYRITNTLD